MVTLRMRVFLCKSATMPLATLDISLSIAFNEILYEVLFQGPSKNLENLIFFLKYNLEFE